MSVTAKKTISFLLVVAMVLTLLPTALFSIPAYAVGDKSPTGYDVLVHSDGSYVKQEELEGSILDAYNYLNNGVHTVWYDHNADNVHSGIGMHQDPHAKISGTNSYKIYRMTCADWVAWAFGYYCGANSDNKGPVYLNNNPVKPSEDRLLMGQDSVYKLTYEWLGDGTNPGNSSGNCFELVDIRGMTPKQIAEVAHPGDILTFSADSWKTPYDLGSYSENANSHAAIYMGLDEDGDPYIIDCTPGADTYDPGVRMRKLKNQNSYVDTVSTFSLTAEEPESDENVLMVLSDDEDYGIALFGSSSTKGKYPMGLYRMTAKEPFDYVGYVNMVKVGSDKPTQPLVATFQAYTDPDCNAGSKYGDPFKTNADGSAVAIKLDTDGAKTLYFKEISAPAGYTASNVIYKATVDSKVHNAFNPATITLAIGGAVADGKIVNQPGGNGEAHIIVDYNIPGFTATATTDTAASSTVDCGAHKVGDTVTLKLALNGTSLAKDATMTLYNQNDVKVTAKFKGLSTSADGTLDVTHKGGDTYEYQIQHDGLTILYAVWELDANCSKTHGGGGDDPDPTPTPTPGGDGQFHTVFWDYNFDGGGVTSSVYGEATIDLNLWKIL